jgi:hypothetical protein
LPLIVGDKVPVGNEHYKFLLHLSKLVDLAFAPIVTRGSVTYMKKFIRDHLTMCADLFGDRVTLKPKHHFLVHLPTIVIKIGPLVCILPEVRAEEFVFQEECFTLSAT